MESKKKSWEEEIFETLDLDTSEFNAWNSEEAINTFRYTFTTPNPTIQDEEAMWDGTVLTIIESLDSPKDLKLGRSIIMRKSNG